MVKPRSQLRLHLPFRCRSMPPPLHCPRTIFVTVVLIVDGSTKPQKKVTIKTCRCHQSRISNNGMETNSTNGSGPATSSPVRKISTRESWRLTHCQSAARTPRTPAPNLSLHLSVRPAGSSCRHLQRHPSPDRLPYTTQALNRTFSPTASLSPSSRISLHTSKAQSKNAATTSARG